MKLFLLAHLFFCACAVPLERIMNGQDAQRNQFPYQVLTYYDYDESIFYICGGVLLSPSWILTAATCDIDASPRFVVMAGILEREEVGQRSVVAQVITHPNYDGYYSAYDIALVQLGESVTFTESVQPIALPAAGTIPQGEGIVTGWGKALLAGTLQYAQVPIITYEECSNALLDRIGTTRGYYETDVCTGPLTEGGISACFEDQGGPLVQDGVLIGIVKWQPLDCSSGPDPVVYARVSDHLDFILEHVDDLPGRELLV